MPGSSTTSVSDECDCGYDGEEERCIEGAVYVPCSEFCYGVCEYAGECDCDCHKS